MNVTAEKCVNFDREKMACISRFSRLASSVSSKFTTPTWKRDYCNIPRVRRSQNEKNPTPPTNTSQSKKRLLDLIGEEILVIGIQTDWAHSRMLLCPGRVVVLALSFDILKEEEEDYSYLWNRGSTGKKKKKKKLKEKKLGLL